MRISKRYLKRVIREEMKAQYGKNYLSRTHPGGKGELADPELDYSQPEKRTHSHEHSHDDQGYDAREDERLAAEDGAGSSHKQDYKDRRDDAGFEVRHESRRRLSRQQIRKIVREERRRQRLRRLVEDSIDSELDHLKKNVHDDIEHIRDLKDDIKDDHEEEVRAEKEKKKHESFQRRVFKQRIRRMVRESHELAAEETTQAEFGAGPLTIPVTDTEVEVAAVDVPVPDDYHAVRDLLDQNPELVDLGLGIVMDMAGTSCERSTAQGVIDHLQDMLGSEGREELPLNDLEEAEAGA